MSKTCECGKCGRNNPPHRQKCQTWNCREKGPDQGDGGYWDCGCGCESNFASRSKCRSCGIARGRYQQQQGQGSRKLQSTQSSFAAAVAEEAAKLHAQLGQSMEVEAPMMESGPDVVPSEEAARATSYLAGEPGCFHCSSHTSRGGRRECVPDSAGQSREAQAGPGSALCPQNAAPKAHPAKQVPSEALILVRRKTTVMVTLRWTLANPAVEKPSCFGAVMMTQIRHRCLFRCVAHALKKTAS